MTKQIAGERPWTDVDTWRKDLHKDFELALTETKLPERPGFEQVNKFLIRARREDATPTTNFTEKIYE